LSKLVELDGNIHPLDSNFAIIGHVFDNIENIEGVREFQIEFSKKYAEYLYSFDKDKVIEILMNELMKAMSPFHYPPDYFQFIFKPENHIGSFKQNASFILKFQRAEKDNL